MLEIVLSTICRGAVHALVAVGFVRMFSVGGVLNVAYGTLTMPGGCFTCLFYGPLFGGRWLQPAIGLPVLVYAVLLHRRLLSGSYVLVMTLAVALSAPPLALGQTAWADWLVKAFAIAILGGLGSVPGAVVAACVLGDAEVLITLAVSDQLADPVALLVIVLVLVLRPSGRLAWLRTMPPRSVPLVLAAAASTQLDPAPCGHALLILAVVYARFAARRDLLCGPAALDNVGHTVFIGGAACASGWLVRQPGPEPRPAAPCGPPGAAWPPLAAAGAARAQPDCPVAQCVRLHAGWPRADPEDAGAQRPARHRLQDRTCRRAGHPRSP